MANFYVSQNITSKFEGGFFNDRTAGWTYAGIAKDYHPEWPGFDRLIWLQQKLYPGRIIPWNHIFGDKLLDQQVLDFYSKIFWPLILGDHIENQMIANMIYDFFVHKQNNAITVINASAKVYSPNVKTLATKISPQVVSVINQVPGQFYDTLRKNRILYYKTKPGFSSKSRRLFIARVNELPTRLSIPKPLQTQKNYYVKNQVTKRRGLFSFFFN